MEPSGVDALYSATVLAEQQRKQINEIKATLLADQGGKAYFPECSCVALIKRGRYHEIGCDAHKFTLRNSKPHPFMRMGGGGASPSKSLSSSQSAPALVSPLNLPMSPIKTEAKQATGKKPKSRQGKRTGTPTENSLPRRQSRSSESQRRDSKNHRDESAVSPTKKLPALASPVKTLLSVEISAAPVEPVREAFVHPQQAVVLECDPIEMDRAEVLEMLMRYDKLLRLHAEPPQNMATLFIRRSTLRAALGQYDEALEDADTAIKIEPTRSVAYYRKGYALFGLARYPEASDAFQQGLAYDVHSRQLMHALNETLARMRHHRPHQPARDP